MTPSLIFSMNSFYKHRLNSYDMWGFKPTIVVKRQRWPLPSWNNFFSCTPSVIAKLPSHTHLHVLHTCHSERPPLVSDTDVDRTDLVVVPLDSHQVAELSQFILMMSRNLLSYSKFSFYFSKESFFHHIGIFNFSRFLLLKHVFGDL